MSVSSLAFPWITTLLWLKGLNARVILGAMLGLPKQTGPRWRARLSVIWKTSMKRNNSGKHEASPRTGILGPCPGARPGEGARWRAPGGRVVTHGAWPGSARKSYRGLHSCGPTTCIKALRGPVHCGLAAAKGGIQSTAAETGFKNNEC